MKTTTTTMYYSFDMKNIKLGLPMRLMIIENLPTNIKGAFAFRILDQVSVPSDTNLNDESKTNNSSSYVIVRSASSPALEIISPYFNEPTLYDSYEEELSSCDYPLWERVRRFNKYYKEDLAGGRLIEIRLFLRGRSKERNGVVVHIPEVIKNIVLKSLVDVSKQYPIMHSQVIYTQTPNMLVF